jgi:hypothetical protein
MRILFNKILKIRVIYMPKVTNKIEPCDIDYLLSKGWDNFGVSISTPNEIEQYDVDYLLEN